MKKLLLLSLLFVTTLPAKVNAQQTNVYGVCTQYREVYTPGYYNQYGNYIQGSVGTQSYNVPCNNNGYTQYYNPQTSQPVPYSNNGYGSRTPACTTLGAAIGAGIGYWSTKKVSYRWATIPAGVILGGLTGNYTCR